MCIMKLLFLCVLSNHIVDQLKDLTRYCNNKSPILINSYSLSFESNNEWYDHIQ